MASIRNALLLAYAALATAARLTVSIPPSQLLPNPSTLPSSSHAILLGPPGTRYDAPLRKDNTFLFPDLQDASYLLTIHSHNYFFPPLRVDVTSSEGNGKNISAWATFRGNEWDNKGQFYGTGKEELTISVKAGAEKQFYQERGGFNILSFLKSPMILMGLASVVLIFGMPYLMDNMDAETKEEFEGKIDIFEFGVVVLLANNWFSYRDEQEESFDWQFRSGGADAELRFGGFLGWDVEVIGRWTRWWKEEVVMVPNRHADIYLRTMQAFPQRPICQLYAGLVLSWASDRAIFTFCLKHVR